MPAVLFGSLVGQTSGEIAGLAAVVGHITSPLLKGRGGKGVATTLGAILGVQPLLAVPVLIAFGIGVAIWHRVGLGAVLAAVTLIVSGLVGWALGWTDESDMWFAVVLGTLVLVPAPAQRPRRLDGVPGRRLTLSTARPTGVGRAQDRCGGGPRGQARPSVTCHEGATGASQVPSERPRRTTPRRGGRGSGAARPPRRPPRLTRGR